ncbi:serine/threonine protein kinase [Isoalcanivorax beigongshangi]|uniref:Stress response kinase A n=1 Tax=Isoalcanivorax beigongshangi TaxID=3238810 RepID=A0ABV4AMY1_9GAMM
MTSPFSDLTPDRLMDAIDAQGLLCDGRVTPLNSYENRVFRVGQEAQSPLIAKFYRPGRWSAAQILEEHHFSQQLVDAGVPVVAPQAHRGHTLFEHDGFLFALFPVVPGSSPDLDDDDTLYELGRHLGRLHHCGSQQNYLQRPPLDAPQRARDAADWLLRHAVPKAEQARFQKLCAQLVESIDRAWQEHPFTSLRLHGDSHRGNLLARDDQYWLVDLDDSCDGPAIQDLWLLLDGDRDRQRQQLLSLLDGYQEEFDFERRQLALIEPLRAARMLHHTAWVGQRWDDPAFPRAFPWYGQPHFWPEQCLALAQQLERMQQPPLSLPG